MVRDLHMTPGLIEMRLRIQGTRAALDRVGTRHLGPLHAVALSPGDEQTRLAGQEMGPHEQQQSREAVRSFWWGVRVGRRI